MAKQGPTSFKQTPVMLRARFPIPPTDLDGVVDWAQQTYHENESTMQLLDQLLRNKAGVVPGGNGGGGSGGTPPPYQTNADTVDGFHADEILGKARASSMYPFSDHLSGPVLPGLVNVSYHRLLVNNGLLGVVVEGTSRSGDFRLTGTQRVGLTGRINGNKFHIVLSDTDTNNALIGLLPVSSFDLDDDLWFEQGFGFILRDRATGQGWNIFVDDTNASGKIGIEKYGFFPWE